jgi:putative transposase
MSRARSIHRRFVLASVRRRAAPELTTSKRLRLLELGRAMAHAREQYLRDYWAPRYAMATVGSPHRLVEARRRDGWIAANLSPHQNKVALESALGIVRSSWQAARGRVRVRVLRAPELGRAEREYRLRILDDPFLLQRCLDGIPTEVASDVPQQARRRIERRLARLVLRSRGAFPRRPPRLWFDIDTNLYRAFGRPDDRYFHGAWLAITSLEKGHRIVIPLRGSDLATFASRTGRSESRPNLRIYLADTIEFETVRRVQRRPPGHELIGVDLGYRSLVVASTGSPDSAECYGDDQTSRSSIVDAAAERHRQRQRMRALERSLRIIAPAKARRVRRRNLGPVRVRRRSIQERRQLRDEANRALNQLFAKHRLARIVHEALGFSSFRLRRVTNRRLARWLWGFLLKRLQYKAELNGVELQVVAAAYTSQACPRCWFTSAKNRRGDRFLCIDCGYSGSADAVAATNVLRRGSDPVLTGLVAPSVIRQILDARWRSARSGRARGSNEQVPAVDVPPESHLGQSREQPEGDVALAGPYGPALSLGPVTNDLSRGGET